MDEGKVRMFARFELPPRGGITEIPGAQNSREIQELARFAIDEHNKKQNTQLTYNKVVNAQRQVVQVAMYYITLEAVDGNRTNKYEAKVSVKERENFKELQEFKRADAHA